MLLDINDQQNITSVKTYTFKWAKLHLKQAFYFKGLANYLNTHSVELQTATAFPKMRKKMKDVQVCRLSLSKHVRYYQSQGAEFSEKTEQLHLIKIFNRPIINIKNQSYTNQRL